MKKRAALSIPRLIVSTLICFCWAGLLLGTSQLHHLELGHFASLCGRWGCLAPNASLLGMHLFWLLFFGGVTAACLLYKPEFTRPLQWILLSGGVIATLGVCIQAINHWRPVDGNELSRLIPFSLVSQSDFPAMQFIAIGLTLFVIRRGAIYPPDNSSTNETQQGRHLKSADGDIVI